MAGWKFGRSVFVVGAALGALASHCRTSVSSFDGYLKPPPPACTGKFIDYGCDGSSPAGATGSSVPLDCKVPDQVISFDPAGGRHCPYCKPRVAGEPALSCSVARGNYRDFLANLVSASCANYCDSDGDCFGVEIKNACGDFVMSLRGSIDEEPLAFAEEYARTHCAECGPAGQRTSLRRPHSAPPAGTPLEFLEPRCVEHQCVLAREP